MRRRDFLRLLSATGAKVVAGGAVLAGPAQGAAQGTPGSPPPAGSPPAAEGVRFIALGDMGTGESNQYSLAAGMAGCHDQHPFDVALTLGDNIYPNGDPALFKEKFERPYAELLRRGVRFYAALGNHDVRLGREAAMRYPDFNMNGQAYYSFVKGGGLVEFFALDSTAPDAAQMRWLEGALSASGARWKLGYFHHPIYSSAMRHGSETRLRARLEPLFVKYGVAAALSGHDHVYERTRPQRGVQYFVCGAGGQLRRGDLDRRSPFFAAGNDQVNSFMCFEATPERLSFRSLDAAGKTLDEGLIAAAPALPAAGSAGRLS